MNKFFIDIKNGILKLSIIIFLVSITTPLLCMTHDQEIVTHKDEKASFHNAAAQGDLEKVTELCSQGAQVNAVDSEFMKWTALHHAAKHGREDVCRYLIGQKANILAQTSQSSTPLHLAAENGHEKVCVLLIAAIQDLITQDKSKKKSNTFDLQDCWQKTALHYAAANGYDTICSSLILAGAQKNIQDTYDFTPADVATGKARTLFSSE